MEMIMQQLVSRYVSFRIYSGVKLLFSTCVFLTYFLQFYVPMLIIQPPILKHVPEEYHMWADYGIRAGTVILTCKYFDLCV